MSPNGLAAGDALFDWASYWSGTELQEGELLATVLVCAAGLAEECTDRDSFLRACAQAWDQNLTDVTSESESSEDRSASQTATPSGERPQSWQN